MSASTMAFSCSSAIGSGASPIPSHAGWRLPRRSFRLRVWRVMRLVLIFGIVNRVRRVVGRARL